MLFLNVALLWEPAIWLGLGHLNISSFIKTILQYPARNPRVGCSHPVFIVVAVIVCFVLSGLCMWEMLWGSQLNPQLWDMWQNLFFTLLPNFAQERRTLCFLIVMGKTTIASALEAGFSYVGTPYWQNDHWSLPSPACHAQQLGLICQNPSVSALCVQSWKEKASYRTWLSLSSKTQLTPGLTRPRELILPITGCLRNEDAV